MGTAVESEVSCNLSARNSNSGLGCALVCAFCVRACAIFLCVGPGEMKQFRIISIDFVVFFSALSKGGVLVWRYLRLLN